MTKNLILLHGALGSQNQFNALQKSLSPNFDIHTFNFEGHGGRPSNKGFSMHLFTENVLEYLKENDITKTNIFGYSMGGYVALNLAKSHPELIEKIVTLGTKFNWTEESAQKEVRMLNPEKVEEKVPAFSKKLEAEHSPNDWKALMRKTAKMMLGMGSGAKLYDADFQQVDIPVLIGIGSEDRMVTVEESQKIADLLPKGNLKKIEGFQHPIEKVDMEKLAVIIEAFLK